MLGGALFGFRNTARLCSLKTTPWFPELKLTEAKAQPNGQHGGRSALEHKGLFHVGAPFSESNTVDG